MIMQKEFITPILILEKNNLSNNKVEFSND